MRIKATPAAPQTDKKRAMRRGMIPSSFITSASHRISRITAAPAIGRQTRTVVLDQPSAPPDVRPSVRLTMPGISARTTAVSCRLTAQDDQTADPVEAGQAGDEPVDRERGAVRAKHAPQKAEEEVRRLRGPDGRLRARDEERNGKYGEAADGQVDLGGQCCCCRVESERGSLRRSTTATLRET